MTFARNAGALGEHWFSGTGTLDETLMTMEEYILSGGVYGTMEQGVLTRSLKNGKKGLRYYFSRIFPPKNEMIGRYPILKEKPALMPVYRCKRMFGLLRPSMRKRAAAEVRSERKSDSARAERVERMMKQLEIWH